MPTVEIDGVGRVELDDSFLRLSPQEQERTIGEIAQQARQSQSAPSPAAPTGGQEQPSEPEIYAPDGFGGNAYSEQSDRFNDDWIAQQEAAYQAERRQQSPSPSAPAPVAPKPDQTSFLGAAGMGALDGISFGFDDEIGGGLAALVPGIGKSSIWDGKSFKEAAGENIDAYRGVKKAAEDEHFGAYLGGGLAAGLLPFGAAKGVLTAGRGFKGALGAAEGAHRISKASRYGKAAAVGGGIGALYGFGSDEGGITDRLDGAATGAAIGAPLGAAGEKISTAAGRALNPEIKHSRFAEAELAKNPFAAFDAEVVDDLSRAVTDRAVTKGDPKGRAKLTAKTINSIEQSYHVQMKNAMNGLDIAPGEKLRLWKALDSKYGLTADEVTALRGTLEGDAVADAITKVQRLRALTPELKTKMGFLSKAANVTDFIPGIPGIAGRTLRGIARASGDGEAARVNAADKLIAKRKAYAKLGELAGPSGARESNEALFAASAAKQEDELAEQAIRQAEQATRPTRADRSEFANLIAGDNLDPRDIEVMGREAVKRRNRLKGRAEQLATRADEKLSSFDQALDQAPPEARITAKDRKALLAKISNPEPDMRDIRDLVPTDAKLKSRINRREADIADMERTASDWDSALADPSTAPQPTGPRPTKAPSLRDQLIEKATSEGIAGTSGTRAAFRSRLGVGDDDLNRVLDHLTEQFPDAAAELNRIKLNHPTQDRKLWSAIGSHMTKARDDLGIKPRVEDAPLELTTPIDEAAQSRLAKEAESPTTSAEAPKPSAREADLLAQLDELDPIRTTFGEGPDAVSIRDSEAGMLSPEDTAKVQAIQAELRNIRSVDRPLQWQNGKEMFQRQANDSIEAMQSDPQISSATHDALGNAPRQIRDNFRTTSEATDYIEDQVLNDLRAEGLSEAEIGRVKAYLYEVAQAKRYTTPDDLAAGTKYRGRGRSPKTKN